MLVFISLLLSLNAYMLELCIKDVLNECLPLFLCLWYWFEQISITEIEILCAKYLVSYALIDIKFYNFYMCQYAFFVILEKTFVFDSCLRALYLEKLHWVRSNFWSSQGNTIQFYGDSEYLCGKLFTQSSTLHK